MQNHMMNDAMKYFLESSGDFQVTLIDRPEEVVEQCCKYGAEVLLAEVTAYPPWRLEERLKLRSAIKKRNPYCKLALLVHENDDPEVAEQVKQAKRDGLIDQFIYGTINASYLAALLETI